MTLSPAPAWAIPAPEPEPRVEQVAPQPFGATSLYEAAPQENSVSAEEPEEHERYREDFSPVAPVPTPAPTPAPEPVPVAHPDSFGPSSGETPVADEDLAPQWTMLPPLTYPYSIAVRGGPGLCSGPRPTRASAFSQYGEPPREDFLARARQNKVRQVEYRARPLGNRVLAGPVGASPWLGDCGCERIAGSGAGFGYRVPTGRPNLAGFERSRPGRLRIGRILGVEFACC